MDEKNRKFPFIQVWSGSKSNPIKTRRELRPGYIEFIRFGRNGYYLEVGTQSRMLIDDNLLAALKRQYQPCGSKYSDQPHPLLVSVAFLPPRNIEEEDEAARLFYTKKYSHLEKLLKHARDFRDKIDMDADAGYDLIRSSALQVRMLTLELERLKQAKELLVEGPAFPLTFYVRAGRPVQLFGVPESPRVCVVDEPVQGHLLVEFPLSLPPLGVVFTTNNRQNREP